MFLASLKTKGCQSRCGKSERCLCRIRASFVSVQPPGHSSLSFCILFLSSIALTAKFASIRNDRLICRDSQDELINCSIPGGPSIPVDVLSEVVTDEVLHCAIFKPLVGSSAGEDGIPAGILRAVWQSPNGRSVLRLSLLSLSHVSTSWKRAIIHPIPKPKFPEFRPLVRPDSGF